METTGNCTVAFQLERNKSCNKTCSFNYASRPRLQVTAAAAVLSRESEGVECGRMFLEISTTKVLATYLAVDLARAGQGPHNEGMTLRESSLIFVVVVCHLTAAAEFDEDSPPLLS